jgi:hypothetical protein
VPVIAFALLLVVLVLIGIALVPLSLLQRYRVGTTRRPARGWFIGLNLIAVLLSAAIFLLAAALTTPWVPDAFSYSLIGFAAGGVLGIIGLALTRWEPDSQSLHFTPNRSLVLLVTLLVAGRIVYGFWRSWHTWSEGVRAWGAAFGVASSMGVGAVVLGYYTAYWLGVRRRFIRHRQGRWR